MLAPNQYLKKLQMHIHGFYFYLQDISQYVLGEMQALEAEQRQIDRRADIVEKKLRRLMESGKSMSTVFLPSNKSKLKNFII